MCNVRSNTHDRVTPVDILCFYGGVLLVCCIVIIGCSGWRFHRKGSQAVVARPAVQGQRSPREVSIVLVLVLIVLMIVMMVLTILILMILILIFIVC